VFRRQSVSSAIVVVHTIIIVIGKPVVYVYVCIILEMYQHFRILGEQVRQYRRFNAAGTQITVRLKHPPDTETDSVAYFLASVEELFEYALANVADGDMVGVSIRNEDNQNDKAVGIRFRRKDQISGDVIWSVFEKVTQSNARFNAIDRLVVDVHSKDACRVRETKI
jgi:hypothetical protein